MNVGKVCSRHPITASASTALSEVARLMYDNRVGAVIITRAPADAPVAAGIITDRDIARAQLDRSADLGSTSAGQVMTKDPLVVCEDDSIEEALRRMRERGVRRAPVVTTSGALTGIVTTDDLVVQFAHEVSALGRLIERQAAHRTQRDR